MSKPVRVLTVGIVVLALSFAALPLLVVAAGQAPPQQEPSQPSQPSAPQDKPCSDGRGAPGRGREGRGRAGDPGRGRGEGRGRAGRGRGEGRGREGRGRGPNQPC